MRKPTLQTSRSTTDMYKTTEHTKKSQKNPKNVPVSDNLHEEVEWAASSSDADDTVEEKPELPADKDKGLPVLHSVSPVLKKDVDYRK